MKKGYTAFIVIIEDELLEPKKDFNLKIKGKYHVLGKLLEKRIPECILIEF